MCIEPTQMSQEISQTNPTNLIWQFLPSKLCMTSDFCPILGRSRSFAFSNIVAKDLKEVLCDLSLTSWVPFLDFPINQLSVRHQGPKVSSARLGRFEGKKTDVCL